MVSKRLKQATHSLNAWNRLWSLKLDFQKAQGHSLSEERLRSRDHQSEMVERGLNAVFDSSQSSTRFLIQDGGIGLFST